MRWLMLNIEKVMSTSFERANYDASMCVGNPKFIKVLYNRTLAGTVQLKSDQLNQTSTHHT